MAKKIDESIIVQINPLYEELKNKTEVAKRLGISVNTVNKYLTIGKVETKKRTIITQDIINKINELYAEHRNATKVANELNIAATTVKKYLTPENLELGKRVNDDRDALWYYIYKLFGQDSEEYPVSKWNLTQMSKFKNQGYDYRVQLLTLKWYYEIKKNPVKPEYKTIGIIPFICAEAGEYYKREAKKQKEIENAIHHQLEQDRIEIKYNPSDYIGRKKKKNLINLDEIGDINAED